MRRELLLRRARPNEQSHARSGVRRPIPLNEGTGKHGTMTRFLTRLAAAGAEQRSRREAAKYQTRPLTRRRHWPLLAAALIGIAAVGLGLRQNLIAAALPVPQHSSVVIAQKQTSRQTAIISTPTLVPTVAVATPVAPTAPAASLPPIVFDIQGDGPTFRVTGVGALGLLVRPAPNRSGAPIGALTEGSVVTVLSSDVRGDGWTWNRVRDQNGTEGWVVAQYLTQQAAPSAPAVGQSAQP